MKVGRNNNTLAHVYWGRSAAEVAAQREEVQQDQVARLAPAPRPPHHPGRCKRSDPRVHQRRHLLAHVADHDEGFGGEGGGRPAPCGAGGRVLGRVQRTVCEAVARSPL